MVHLNGGELYDVEPAAAAFESTGSFEVELRNHGQPVHVHLRLDEDLSRVASLSGTNHYVEGESVLRVPVAVADDAPSVRGMLKVVTGYGSGTDYVEVHVSDGRDEAAGVAVDRDLGRPAGPDGGDGGRHDATGALVDRLPVDAARLADRVDPGRALALGVAVAVALATSAIAVVAAPGLAVVSGIFAVLVGLAVAGYLMVR